MENKMSKSRKPPPIGVRIQPGESPWLALARAVAENPEGPVALGVMSHINQAMRPRELAADRLVEALARSMEEPDALGVQSDIAAARIAWETMCDTAMTDETLELFSQDAAQLVENRKKSPPEMSRILLDGADGRRDYGYELGGDLSGLQGTWHRLWASISMNRLLGTDPEDAVPELRAEFERQLGRPLAPVEWDQLVAHAHRHCDVVMRSRFQGASGESPD